MKKTCWYFFEYINPLSGYYQWCSITCTVLSFLQLMIFFFRGQHEHAKMHNYYIQLRKISVHGLVCWTWIKKNNELIKASKAADGGSSSWRAVLSWYCHIYVITCFHSGWASWKVGGWFATLSPERHICRSPTME